MKMFYGKKILRQKPKFICVHLWLVLIEKMKIIPTNLRTLALEDV